MARQAAPTIFARFANAKAGRRPDNIVPPSGFEQVGSGAGEDGGTNGGIAGDTDTGAINLASQSQKAPKRPRGRPPNAAKQSAAEAEAKVSVEPPEFAGTIVTDIARSLSYIHVQLAMGMQCPEMALSDQEAATLAKQVANVGKYYVKIDGGGKVWAHFALLFTLLILYIPRWMVLKRRQMMATQAPGIGHNQAPQEFVMPEGVMPP